MSFLPVEPHLIELLLRMQEQDISLIIAGGLGIYLKRRWVLEQLEAGVRENLLNVLPDARATDDIDAFLQLQVFLQPARGQFRRALAELGYESRTHHLKFQKPLPGDTDRNVSIDLLAPRFDDSRLKSDKRGRIRRVGARDNKKSIPEERLHGFETPEAFAIEERPQALPLIGRTPQGEGFVGEVRVPHPFASLCMKIKAASDYETADPSQRKPRGQKHAQDVYLLMAMLSQDEWDECEVLREQFAKHNELRSICNSVVQLFASPDQPACITIAGGNRDADLQRFTEVIKELFNPG